LIKGAAPEDPTAPPDTTDKYAHVPEQVRRMIESKRAARSQTGPKGVLADAEMARALERADREGKRQEREAILRRIAEGHKIDEASSAILAAVPLHANDDYQDDDDEDEDDDDDEFMRSFREKRLGELQARQQSASLQPRFGTVRDVDASELASALDDADSRIVVAVHLYEPSIPTCARLNRILDELAAAMPTLLFLRMPASANGVSVDRVALPMVSLYRGGESLGALAGIAHELGTDFFTREQVEELLVLELDGKV
jgi:hypothetical protein